VDGLEVMIFRQARHEDLDEEQVEERLQRQMSIRDSQKLTLGESRYSAF